MITEVNLNKAYLDSTGSKVKFHSLDTTGTVCYGYQFGSVVDIPVAFRMDGTEVGGDTYLVEEYRSKPEAKEKCWDEDKPSISLVPNVALLSMARVFALGGSKPGRTMRGWESWSTYPWTDGKEGTMRYFTDKIYRHAGRMAEGEVFDGESGLPHASHVASNCAALLWCLRDLGLVTDDGTATGEESPFPGQSVKKPLDKKSNR